MIPVDGVRGDKRASRAESFGDCDRDMLRALALREMLRGVDRGRRGSAQ
jgi:hypothetical protein